MAETKKYVFEKLTPVNDSDISVYESAIDFVFNHDDVRNVAISGAYGAGNTHIFLLLVVCGCTSAVLFR